MLLVKTEGGVKGRVCAAWLLLVDFAPKKSLLKHTAPDQCSPASRSKHIIATIVMAAMRRLTEARGEWDFPSYSYSDSSNEDSIDLDTATGWWNFDLGVSEIFCCRNFEFLGKGNGKTNDWIHL